ncbi:MAG TPA: hypothetical protein VMD91_05075 [Candidatus Sulfotelmatobacter sp.]|nr:hypothetical protein [Candidatus Sulfotelmatobacter sp.]
MSALARPRRFALAAVALACAALLFRGEVATALVTRGDDALRGGDVDRAVNAYARATAIDARSAVAADRLAFFLLVRRGRGDAALALAVAVRALRAVPNDPLLLADRGFAAQRLGRIREAERAFAAAALGARDPRYAQLAGRMAQRAHEPTVARHDFAVALALAPDFAPARAALRELTR